MTRKRFVKLLMARGFSRNQANQTAKVSMLRHGSYELAYIAWSLGITKVPDAFRNFSRALSNLVTAATARISELTEALHDNQTL